MQRQTANVNMYEKKIKELELLNQVLLEKLAEYDVQYKSSLRSYGKENLDYITDISYINLIKYPTLGMIELVKLIHYNNKHPENRNITSTDQDIIKIKEEDGWVEVNINDFVYPFINRLFAMMDQFYIKNVKGLDHMVNVEERFENMRHRIENRDKNCMTFFHNQIRAILSRKK